MLVQYFCGLIIGTLQATFLTNMDIEVCMMQVIQGREWYWPQARSESIVELQSRLPKVDIGEVDQPI
jgi:hypothetical protein